MMRRTMLGVALIAAGCGGGTPTAPAPATPSVVVTPAPNAPTTYAVSGAVTATNGAQAISGLSVSLAGETSTTDTGGRFTLHLSSATSSVLKISGPEIVPRSIGVTVSGPRSVTVDAIRLGAGFDLAFYRELVRNGYDAPAAFQPLRRWIRTPRVYLKTVDEAGEAIHGPTLDVIEAAVKDAVPVWTSGALGVPEVERGTDTREWQAGWITIRFPSTNTAISGSCGRSQVGVDGGWIELNYHSPSVNGVSCRGTASVIAPHVVRHEIGHALGFYHTGTQGDLMYSGGSWWNATGFPTPREVAHAAIAYARPVGNVDPDSDPQ